MGVYIKGMRMPENCSECPVALSGKYCRITKTGETFKELPIRPNHCPLVELPDKHGDLIDRDAFRADYGMKDDCADCEKEMRGKVKACRYDYIYSKMDLCYWLDDADIVIEAEDGE